MGVAQSPVLIQHKNMNYKLWILFSVLMFHGCSLPDTRAGNQCFDINECIMTINKKIGRNWIKPVSNEQLSATVSIELVGDALMSGDIVESSGNEEFDSSVLSAVYKSTPFPEIFGLSVDDRNELRKIKFIFKSDR